MFDNIMCLQAPRKAHAAAPTVWHYTSEVPQTALMAQWSHVRFFPCVAAADLRSLHIPAQVIVKLIIVRRAHERAIVVELPSCGATQIRKAG